MGLFDPDNRSTSPASNRLYAAFEVVHTIVDFAAAGLFIVGSLLFFSESLRIPGTWCFLIGSICFALKPAIRLLREIRLAALKDVDRLASSAPELPE